MYVSSHPHDGYSNDIFIVERTMYDNDEDYKDDKVAIISVLNKIDGIHEVYSKPDNTYADEYEEPSLIGILIKYSNNKYGYIDCNQIDYNKVENRGLEKDISLLDAQKLLSD